MQFSIGLVAPTIIQTLRYFFSSYGKNANFIWNADENKRTLDIYEGYDINRTPLQEKPRIVIMRGGFNIGKTGISDNLAIGKPVKDTKGNKDSTNMVFYQGVASITIEARNKGTCELLTDMAVHFLLWSRPIICDAHGWKEFGMPMSVSECIGLVDEDPKETKYQTQIQIPWIKEEQWRVQTDGPELKKVLLDVHLQE